VIVNLSVWTSLEALWAFVYGGAHVGVMQRRRQWFERPAESHLALWWVAAGTRPAVAEAVARLTEHRMNGPAPRAFDFKHPFTPGGEPLDPAALRILPAACG
jgi:hypothetical protein